MELTAYTELIKQLPYKDQAFVTRRNTWKSFKGKKHFAQFYADTFLSEEAVILSRGDLLSMAKKDVTGTIFSTILWGYPRGYTRANNMARSFPLFLKQVEYLSERLSVQKQITTEDLEAMLKKCKGIGLSTLSKLLYFFNVKLDKNPCLIMDARIVNVLSNGEFTELGTLSGVREHNKVKYYTEYLKTCVQLSKKNGYKPDQLELFLFMFGNNLKQANLSTFEL